MRALSLALSAAALVSPVLLTRVAGDALIWYAMTVTAIGPALLALAVRARGDRGDGYWSSGLVAALGVTTLWGLLLLRNDAGEVGRPLAFLEGILIGWPLSLFGVGMLGSVLWFRDRQTSS